MYSLPFFPEDFAKVAGSLKEFAEMLSEEASIIEAMADDGVELDSCDCCGTIQFVTDDPAVAMKWGMTEDDGPYEDDEDDDEDDYFGPSVN